MPDLLRPSTIAALVAAFVTLAVFVGVVTFAVLVVVTPLVRF